MQKFLEMIARMLIGSKGEEFVRLAVERLRLMLHSLVDYAMAALLAALLAYLATPSDNGEDWVRQGSTAATVLSTVGYEQGDTMIVASAKFSGAWIAVAILRYVVPLLLSRFQNAPLRSIIIFFMLAGTSSAWAQSITGPSEIGEDDPAVFSIELAESAQVAWDAYPKPAAKLAALGNSSFLYGPPGSYQVEAMVVDFDARNFRKVFHTVAIKPRDGSTPPSPPPGPFVPPGPAGFDWEKWATESTRAFPPDERFKVAEIFKTESANQNHREVEDLLIATQTRIRNNPGSKWNNWMKQFKQLFERELADAELSEWRIVWNRVAGGMTK